MALYNRLPQSYIEAYNKAKGYVAKLDRVPEFNLVISMVSWEDWGPSSTFMWKRYATLLVKDAPRVYSEAYSEDEKRNSPSFDHAFVESIEDSVIFRSSFVYRLPHRKVLRCAGCVYSGFMIDEDRGPGGYILPEISTENGLFEWEL